MGAQEFTKSGAFVAIVFALVVVLVPFGLEQIGETTGWFDFPVTKTITGWFSAGSRVSRDRLPASKPVDWERYRKDLEDFTRWADGQVEARISLPPPEAEVIEVVEEERPERVIWHVPVASCTAGSAVGGGAADVQGYVFISGIDHPYREGTEIEPSEELCGYEIVCIGERSVWFRAILGREGGSPMGMVKFPEFTRVEGESLVKGSRKYVVRDAFPLKSGGWLMVDSFMPPDGVVFKILDENRREVATLLCIVIGEKGDKP